MGISGVSFDKAEGAVVFDTQPAANPTPANERTAKLADPGFGRVFTDHMAIVRYSQGKGWHPVSLDKLGSWYLLMIISFVLVAALHHRLGRKEGQGV